MAELQEGYSTLSKVFANAELFFREDNNKSEALGENGLPVESDSSKSLNGVELSLSLTAEG